MVLSYAMGRNVPVRVQKVSPREFCGFAIYDLTFLTLGSKHDKATRQLTSRKLVPIFTGTF
jgi:hypothetical protein